MVKVKPWEAAMIAYLAIANVLLVIIPHFILFFWRDFIGPWIVFLVPVIYLASVMIVANILLAAGYINKHKPTQKPLLIARCIIAASALLLSYDLYLFATNFN